VPTCKLILHSHELPDCRCYRRIFATEFETHVTYNEAQFLGSLREASADAAVLCFCSAREADVPVLLHLAALAGPVPVMACCKNYDPGFVHLAAAGGVTNFLLCDMQEDKIRKFVLRAIRESGLQGFLASYGFPRFGSSPHSARLTHEIVHAFPHRLTVKELSQRLGMTTRRLQSVCRQTFGRSYTHLMRLISIHQALTLMRNTSLDNVEIALQLDYGDESSLARIFRKELGYSPSEARKRLVHLTPEELLKNRA
jgi:AraC-like DNA-binding protein